MIHRPSGRPRVDPWWRTQRWLDAERWEDTGATGNDDDAGADAMERDAGEATRAGLARLIGE